MGCAALQQSQHVSIGESAEVMNAIAVNALGQAGQPVFKVTDPFRRLEAITMAITSHQQQPGCRHRLAHAWPGPQQLAQATQGFHLPGDEGHQWLPGHQLQAMVREREPSLGVRRQPIEVHSLRDESEMPSQGLRKTQHLAAAGHHGGIALQNRQLTQQIAAAEGVGLRREGLQVGIEAETEGQRGPPQLGVADPRHRS